VVYCVGPRYGHLLDGLPALVASDLEESLIGEGTCTLLLDMYYCETKEKETRKVEARDKTQLLL
jgi:hypothetical protein